MMRSDGANQSLFIMRCKVTLKIDMIIHGFVRVYDLTFRLSARIIDKDVGHRLL